MSLGKMRHRVDVQSLERTSDGAGGSSTSWTTVLSAWASITPTGGREYIRGMQISSEVTHIIQMRYSDKVNTNCRISHDGKLYNITRVLNIDEREKYIEIQASTGVAI